MLKLNLKIGKYPIQLEAEDLRELFRETELLSQLPKTCGRCASDDIGPGYSKSQKGDEFFFLRCNSCAGEFKIGQRKSDNALFPQFNPGRPHKHGWMEPFRRSEEGSESSMTDAFPDSPVTPGDDYDS